MYRTILFCFFVSVLPVFAEGLPVETLSLPPGFHIEVLTDQVPGARSMVFGSKGTLFIGTRAEGKVYAVTFEGNRASKVIAIARGLDMPNGVAFRDGALFVTETARVLRYDDIENRLNSPPEPRVINDSLPDKKGHGWRYTAFGPDGKLYIGIGAPCNVCESKDPRFASIARMNADGSGLEVFARGVRNTVGFDWDPDTRGLWFTDNGRDWLGDDRPPDELNHASRPGMHFGFPYCHGNSVLDPQYGKGHACSAFTPPEKELDPHVAALGMRFYTGDMFPPAYRGRIFIAEHGSWNRSKPIGYRVMMVRLKEGKAVSYDIFAQGWLKEGKTWGRPVDVLVMPDGALLISDDKAGAVYRVHYSADR